VAERLRRFELAAELLPAILRVLDVREVLDRLSSVAKRALPHDPLILRCATTDSIRVRAALKDCAIGILAGDLSGF